MNKHSAATVCRIRPGNTASGREDHRLTVGQPFATLRLLRSRLLAQVAAKVRVSVRTSRSMNEIADSIS